MTMRTKRIDLGWAWTNFVCVPLDQFLHKKPHYTKAGGHSHTCSPRNFATTQIYCPTALFTGCLTTDLRGRKVARASWVWPQVPMCLVGHWATVWTPEYFTKMHFLASTGVLHRWFLTHPIHLKHNAGVAWWFSSFLSCRNTVKPCFYNVKVCDIIQKHTVTSFNL
jgi:hypothetical protein